MMQKTTLTYQTLLPAADCDSLRECPAIVDLSDVRNALRRARVYLAELGLLASPGRIQVRSGGKGLDTKLHNH